MPALTFTPTGCKVRVGLISCICRHIEFPKRPLTLPPPPPRPARPPLSSKTTATEVAPVPLARTRLDLTWTAKAPLRFAQSPGDTLWSALGRHVREADVEVYRSLFKPTDDGRAVPSPFVIACPAPDRVPEGGLVEASVMLLGDTAGAAPYWERAAAALEDSGLGAGRDDGRGAVRFLGSRAEAVRPAPAPETQALRLCLLTPTFLKAGEDARRPTLDLLLRRLGWRVRELCRLYGTAAVPDFRPLIAHARGVVRSEPVGLHFKAGARYSRRRERERGAGRIPTGGHLGALHLRGDWRPLWPLLEMGQSVHVGKNTERGYGRYRLENLSDGSSDRPPAA